MTWTQHETWDILLSLLFLVGLAFHMLLNADTAKNAGRYARRRDYFAHNFVPLGVRAAIETALFISLRHVDLNDAIAYFGWKLPFTLPKEGAVVCFFAGYFADSLLNYIGNLPGLPDRVSKFIVENIPPIPAVLAAQQVVDAAKETVAAAQLSADKVKQAAKES